MSKEVVCKTADLSREDWLRHRISGIGGSEAASIMGEDEHCRPLTLYQEKIGVLHRDLLEEEKKSEMVAELVGDTGIQPAYFGTRLEEFVAQEFTRMTGLEVMKADAMYRSVEHPFMIANVDRIIVGKNMGLECKTAGFYIDNKRNPWENGGVPNNYYIQCQHYMAVMDWEGMYIACLIGGQRFVYRYIPRADNTIKALIAAEKEFWRHVELRIPPEAGLGDEPLVKATPETQYDMIPAIDSDGSTIAELKKAKAEQKELDNKVTLLELKLKQRIGEHSGIDGLVTWKTTKGKSVTDWEAVASELNAQPEVIEKYTRYQVGHRRLLLK